MTNKWVEQQIILRDDMVDELGIIYRNANCDGCPTEWFFPPIGKGQMIFKPGTLLHSALSTCADCVVMEECYAFAKKHKCTGVWGGAYFNTLGKPNKRVSIRNENKLRTNTRNTININATALRRKVAVNRHRPISQKNSTTR